MRFTQPVIPHLLRDLVKAGSVENDYSIVTGSSWLVDEKHAGCKIVVLRREWFISDRVSFMRSLSAGGDDWMLVFGSYQSFGFELHFSHPISVIPDLVRDPIKALSIYLVSQQQPSSRVASNGGQAGLIRYHQTEPSSVQVIDSKREGT